MRALTRAARTLFGSGRAVDADDARRSCEANARSVVADDGKVAISAVVLGGETRDDGTDSEAERAAKRARADEDASDEVASYDVKLAAIPGKFDMRGGGKIRRAERAAARAVGAGGVDHAGRRFGGVAGDVRRTGATGTARRRVRRAHDGARARGVDARR